ncbi:MAG: flagellar biosynthesis protein FlgN [Treponema sp.]
MQNNTLLTDSELAERVAILKRFKSLLQQQRAQFYEYLNVLEKQEHSITAENSEAIVAHTKLGESIVANIFTIQKVIDPLEYMYQNLADSTALDTTIPKLKTELADLQQQVLTQNKKNRTLLESQVSILRRQITELKRPYAQKESIYAESTNNAKLIDIVS